MKTKTPCLNSGKTYFSRVKSRGQSWVALRDAAIRAGSWHPRQQIVVDKREDD